MSFQPDANGINNPFDQPAAMGELQGNDTTFSPTEIVESRVGDVLNATGDAGVFQASESVLTIVDHVWLRDFQTGPRTLEASDKIDDKEEGFARRPAISRDASRLAYRIEDGRSEIPIARIHLEDITIDGGGARTIDISAGTALGEGDDEADMPMLSDDGRLVSCTSAASDLIPGETDQNGVNDVFLFEASPPGSGRVRRRESVDTGGNDANGASENSDLTLVQNSLAITVFESDATDLIATDGNTLHDVFERTAQAEVASFVPEDMNSDGVINLTDGVSTLNFLSLSGAAPACRDAADANDSGGLDISDGLFVLNWLFQGGPPPAEPSPSDPTYSSADCGRDPTLDGLGCATSSATCPS